MNAPVQACSLTCILGEEIQRKVPFGISVETLLNPGLSGRLQMLTNYNASCMIESCDRQNYCVYFCRF